MMVGPELEKSGSIIAQPKLCPKCGSEYVYVIHRLLFEKLIMKRHKYECSDCGKKFFPPS